MDESLAFSVLLVGRMDELELALDDVVDGVDVGASDVQSWIDGTAVPEDGEIPPLARVLSLPRSLLREARRRADQALQHTDHADAEPEPEPTPAPVEPRESTLEQPVPVAPAVMVATPPEMEIEPEPDLVARILEVVRSPWDMLRDRVVAGRERAQAPTREESYIEDERQRLTYQLRAVFVSGGLIALVLILRWALAGFGSSLADLWDALTSAL